MSPAAPEATNRASTTPRRAGVARLAGRGGEVATATGGTPRRSIRTWGGFQIAGRPGKRTSTGPGSTGNRSAPVGVPPSRRGTREVGMQLRPHGGGVGGGRDGGRGRVQRERGRRRRRCRRRLGGPGGPGRRPGVDHQPARGRAGGG